MKRKNKKNNTQCFKLIWHYLKDEKLKVVMYIFLIICTMIPSILTAFIWGHTLEALVARNFEQFLLYCTVYIGLFLLFYTILQIPRDFLYTDLEIKFITSASKDLYKKIDTLPARAFEEMGVGEFINRLNGDTEQVISLLTTLVRMICRVIVVIGIFVTSFFISWIIVVEFIAFALIMGLIAAKALPKIKEAQENIKKESDNYAKVSTENITGIREIKSLGIKNAIEKNIFIILDKLYSHSRQSARKSSVYYALNNATFFILEFIVFITCGYLFIQGKISYSLFIMMETFLFRIDDVVESLADFGVNYNKVLVSLNRIDEILNDRLYTPDKYGNITLENPEGIIEFKDVSFRYSEEEDYTLKDFNLVIEKNKKNAIVGRSGNGKSTIFNLLLRYFDTKEGTITIDGVNIQDLNEECLHSTISVIRQSPFLFNMSIFDNFKIVKEDITLEEVREVCQRAYIDEYIMSLPNRYDTVIGEGGINLSGGQKQRLAIARTLLLNTKIILFDEATSALDNVSQEFIKKTIDDLSKDHTVIIIAHRLSTIIDADIINVIEKGKTVGRGTHRELFKNNSTYQSLYNAENE